MCGITGIFDHQKKYQIDQAVLERMAHALHHRGPDEGSLVMEEAFGVGLGFRRLSIIDLAHGQQPFYSEDGNSVLICNGEIYNYRELRDELQAKGYRFKTNCDVEVLVHLYDAYSTDFISRLNGQFAFCIFDKARQRMILARDQFGICPLFYAFVDGVLLFASEIKALLQHPMVERRINITALDQVLSFPGVVSPTSIIKGVNSLKPGHFLEAQGGNVRVAEYWDLDYPQEPYAYDEKPEAYYIEKLDYLLTRSVNYRLNADVPVGFYLSGGLDSSLIGALMKKVRPDEQFKSFSIGFPGVADQEYDERKYQRMMARHLNSIHSEIEFTWTEVEKGLREAVYFSECPLRETYNTCSIALSRSVKESNVKVILSGEGSDEIFGGYVGYRFDTQRGQMNNVQGLDELLELQMRQKLWGDANFFYEKREHEFKDTKRALYSERVNDCYASIDCFEKLEINKERLKNRHPFHKRSYVDLKLRLSDHLIADHCDRVTYANSVEGRYPFLDIDLIEFVKMIPPTVKLKGLVEKYILKRMAQTYLPNEIFNRQKFGFVAPGSPQLLNNKVEWVQDLLSYDQIKRQGYFNPATIERIKKMYSQEQFKLNLPFEDDLLIIVLTFNILLEVFNLPDYSA